ncbi:hypothetical protein HYT45_04615 [Candidatus Uhrbacteria bacterium]|nr:hypothetical protein [Candidatus Uhrbacteria bacterium]
MPIYKAKNENFFKTWTPEMAYVLGFFAADGNLTLGKRGNHFIEFTSCDKEIIEKIREVMGCTHKISSRERNERWKTSYRIQIGSKIIFDDLIKLGLTPNKSLTLKLPEIPKDYLPHFLRGYFDGDGSITVGYFKKRGRKSKSLAVMTRFTCGSKPFLLPLKGQINKLLGTKGSILYYAGAWHLAYGKKDSQKLFSFMYSKSGKDDLIYLDRKYKIYQRAVVA